GTRQSKVAKIAQRSLPRKDEARDGEQRGDADAAAAGADGAQQSPSAVIARAQRIIQVAHPIFLSARKSCRFPAWAGKGKSREQFPRHSPAAAEAAAPTLPRKRGRQGAPHAGGEPSAAGPVIAKPPPAGLLFLLQTQFVHQLGKPHIVTCNQLGEI